MKRRLLRVLRSGLLGATVMLLCAAWLAFGPLPDVDPRGFNQGQNAIWLGHKWYGGAPSDAEIDALARRLAACDMQDLFCHVGPLDACGNVPPPSKRWRAVRDRLRRRLPGIRLMAWLGGLTTDCFGRASDTIDLTLPAVRNGIAADAYRLVSNEGFDGIHYDLELIPDGNPAFLDLLAETRTAIGHSPLSVAAPVLGPPGLRHCFWTPGYMRDVARRCDQMAVMTYDTGMPTQALYERMLAWQVRAACDAVAPTSCRLLFGIPTYKEHTRAHNPLVEQPDPAARGVALGLADLPRRDAFQGVAVYAEWTTAPREWRGLGALWGPSRVGDPGGAIASSQ